MSTDPASFTETYTNGQKVADPCLNPKAEECVSDHRYVSFTRSFKDFKSEVKYVSAVL